MNKIAVGVVALCLSVMSWSVLADEEPTLEAQCKAIGMQHGIAGEKLDEWVKKCIDHNPAAKREQGQHGDKHHEKHGDKHGDKHGEKHGEKHGMKGGHGKAEKHGMSADDKDDHGHGGMDDMEGHQGM